MGTDMISEGVLALLALAPASFKNEVTCDSLVRPRNPTC